MNTAELLGKTIVVIDGFIGSDEIIFTMDDNKKYKFYHQQACCEDVYVQDIIGDLRDLIGSPLTEAEEVSSVDDPVGYSPDESRRESFTWTFYKLGTIKGSVTIRWLGESNGQYSEDVFLREIT